MYVLRRPSVRPGPRAFWLGGVCEGAAGMASVGRDGTGVSRPRWRGRTAGLGARWQFAGAGARCARRVPAGKCTRLLGSPVRGVAWPRVALSKAVARSNVLADSELLAALIELSTPPPLRNSQASQRPALQHALRLRSMCRPCRALSCRVCFLRILFIPSLRLDSRQCQWHWHAST